MPVDMWDEVESDILKCIPPGMVDMSRAIVEEARNATRQGREPNFSAITSGSRSTTGTCDCSCSAMEALIRMGEAADAQGRTPTPAEQQIVACGMTCSAQFAICEAD